MNPLKPSDRLKLRVDALTSRLREISAEVSHARGEAFALQSEIEQRTVSALFEGTASEPSEIKHLRERLETHRERADHGENEEVRLKRLLHAARRDYLVQLRQERGGRWIVLE